MGLRLSNPSRQAEAAAYAATRMRQPSNGDHAQCKRILDIVVAGAALLFVAPLILGIALLIRLQDGSRAFYSQKRFGLNGETFNCFKLRSMVQDAREQLEYLLATDPAARAEWDETQKLTNDPRITALGNFIRKTSIDELPQLYNVLRGDMSLVGPRPHAIAHDRLYMQAIPDYERRFRVKPGMTGLAQVLDLRGGAAA